ncbi:uncharacterized protein LOC116002032 isoform X2 [Ipomoea triloba]|uniref:uncharacterized protein LOC116002032 isoform X2 n=1 Tax=Ipomoea triloba TaxID=35885 RepID=UPI00125D1565|nr:uncharacterized protein LOC116002032 isoform X2 [Ipomoea triloba]
MNELKILMLIWAKPLNLLKRIFGKKMSIFWDLPYWEHLSIRHCLDVLDVEKNICESIVGTLLNIQGKTKDDIKARKDMVEMGIRDKLAPQESGKLTYLPPACYTMSKKEKTSFCGCLNDVKVPSGYSSNIKELVSMKDLKLVGMKSHDCHILMQHLLPVAIRDVLPKHVDVVVTLSQLEMYFPPSFFDIMVHLIIHLVREIKMSGPVFLRYMYPFERYMGVLKGYVRNQFQPKCTIIEGYAAEEVIEFCTDYLANFESIGVLKSRHEGNLTGKGKRSIVGVGDVVDEEEYDHFDETPPFSIGVQALGEDNIETSYMRCDHGEGLWVDNHT